MEEEGTLFRSEAEAKSFFVDRIVSQASAEGQPLSDNERWILRFSESQMLRTIVLVCACSCAVAVFACRPTGGVVATYSSPRGTYTVQLTGNSTRPKALFVEHLVYANASKGSTAVVRNWEIHFADMLDRAFADEYAGADWIHENVLRFRSSGTDREPASDAIVVANRGQQALAFVTVKSEDLFLVFDLAAGASMQLSAPAQATVTDLSWIKVEGQWANGARLSSAGVNFVLPRRPVGQFKYVATISDDGISIREVQQGAQIYR